MLDRIRGKGSSLITKIVFFLIIIALVFIGAGSFFGNISNNVAEVNGEGISVSEFANAYEQAYRVYQNSLPNLSSDLNLQQELKIKVLDELILNKALLQDAKKIGLVSTPQEVYLYLTSLPYFKDESGNFSEQAYRELLAQNNKSASDFESLIADTLVTDKLKALITSSAIVSEEEAKNQYDSSMELRVVDYVLFPKKDYFKDVVVSDDEVLNYYDNNKTLLYQLPYRLNVSYVGITIPNLVKKLVVSSDEVSDYYVINKESFFVPESFKFKPIFISALPKGSENEKEAMESAKSKVKDIEDRLKKGEKFSKIEKTYTDNPIKDEDLVYFPSSSLPPKFLEVFEGLNSGQVTEPFFFENGYWVVELLDKKEAHYSPIEEVTEVISSNISLKKAKEQMEELSKISSDMLRKGSSLEEISVAVGLPVESSGLLDLASLSSNLELLPESSLLLERISVGSTGLAPLESKSGEYVVKVTEALPAETIPLEQVKDSIIAKIKEDKSAEIANKAAEEALDSFISSKPSDKLKSLIKTSEPFTANLGVKPFGDSSNLLDAVFLASSNDWLNQVYDVKEGSVIVKLKSVISADPNNWKEQKAGFIDFYSDVKGKLVFNVYCSTLLEHSNIVINDNLLNSLRFGQAQ